MQYIIRDDGDKRGDMSVSYGRYGFRSRDTIHSSSCNCRVTFNGDWRGGYRYHTSHSYSHILGDHGILLSLSGASHFGHKSLHGNEIGDSRSYYGRHIIRSQETSHSYFKNHRESVDGGGRSGYMYQTSPSTSYNPGELGRLLDIFVHGN